YGYALQDLPCDVAVQEGRHFDLRHYHFGLYDAAGQPKLAARLMGDENIEAVLEIADAPRKAPAVLRTRPVLITGGAGFIGSNLANRLASEGQSVLVLDSLARAGVEENLEWLQTLHPARISAMIADVRSADAVQAAAADAAGV